MTDPQQLAQNFLNALSSNDVARYEAVLSEDVGMRLHRWDGREVYRPRKRVMCSASWTNGRARPIPRWKDSRSSSPAIGGAGISHSGDRE